MVLQSHVGAALSNALDVQNHISTVAVLVQWPGYGFGSQGDKGTRYLSARIAAIGMLFLYLLALESPDEKVSVPSFPATAF
jgi:hypothetical protein